MAMSGWGRITPKHWENIPVKKMVDSTLGNYPCK